MDYLGTLAEAQSCAKVAPYLSYVYPKGDQIKTWHACGVQTFAYTSPAMPQGTEYEHTSITTAALEAQAKDCSGHVLTTYGTSGYLMDAHSANAAAYLQDSINHNASTLAGYNNGQLPDYIFQDNSDEIAGSNVSGTSTSPCGYAGQADWSQATAALYNKITVPSGVKGLILNTLGLPTAFEYPPADDSIANILLPVKTPAVAGAMLEGWVWNNSNQSGYHDLLGNPVGAWQAEEDMQIATVQAGKLFNALSNGTFTTYESDPTSAAGISARMYVYASLLLTYDPNHVLWGEELHTASGVNEMPEQQFLAEYPETVPAYVAQLKDNGGAYVRYYQGCYYHGVIVGPCEIAVNPWTSTVSVPNKHGYQHQMSMSGSDVLDGGTVNFTAPVSSTLAPHTAEILLP